MTDLKTTTALVEAILENDEMSRNSDSFLYLNVLSVVSKREGIDLNAISVPYFLTDLQGDVFPPFESVRRTRQKIQARRPELSACEKVEKYRAENERVYLEYARGAV